MKLFDNLQLCINSFLIRHSYTNSFVQIEDALLQTLNDPALRYDLPIPTLKLLSKKSLASLLFIHCISNVQVYPFANVKDNV